MSGERLIDYAWRKPPDLRAYAGVFRYLSHDDAKDISPAEAAQLVAQGKSITLVFETTATRARDGHQAGMDDAAYANARAANRCPGYDGAIYFAVDYDAMPGEVAAYFRGVKATTDHVVGVYGSGDVIRYLKGAGLAQFGWQSCSTGWRGSTPVGAGVDVHQVKCGTTYDDNVALVDFWGQWEGGDMNAEQDTRLKHVEAEIVHLRNRLDQVQTHIAQRFDALAVQVEKIAKATHAG